MIAYDDEEFINEGSILEMISSQPETVHPIYGELFKFYVLCKGANLGATNYEKYFETLKDDMTVEARDSVLVAIDRALPNIKFQCGMHNEKVICEFMETMKYLSKVNTMHVKDKALSKAIDPNAADIVKRVISIIDADISAAATYEKGWSSIEYALVALLHFNDTIPEISQKTICEEFFTTTILPTVNGEFVVDSIAPKQATSDLRKFADLVDAEFHKIAMEKE